MQMAWKKAMSGINNSTYHVNWNERIGEKIPGTTTWLIFIDNLLLLTESLEYL